MDLPDRYSVPNQSDYSTRLNQRSQIKKYSQPGVIIAITSRRSRNRQIDYITRKIGEAIAIAFSGLISSSN